MTNRRRSLVALVGLPAAAAGLLVALGPTSAAGTERQAEQRDLATARRATARFHTRGDCRRRRLPRDRCERRRLGHERNRRPVRPQIDARARSPLGLHSDWSLCG